MADAIYDAKTDDAQEIQLYRFLTKKNIELSDVVANVEPHFHDAIELIVVESGKYRAWVNGETFTLSRGDILFVDAGVQHAYQHVNYEAVHCINVPLALFENLHFPKKIPRVIRGENKSGRLVRLFNEAQRAWESATEQYKVGFVYSVFGAILQLFPLNTPEINRREDRFNEVLKYVEEHFREQISLDDLTERFGYSKSYFSRTFNSVTGVNLREFLNRRRITEALKIKAENPSVPWVHITVGVGFESWSTFARAYKRYGGKDELEA